MKNKRGGKKVSVLLPKSAKITNNSGWKRMKQIAEKAMENGKFSIEDVRDDLSKLRASYKRK